MKIFTFKSVFYALIFLIVNLPLLAQPSDYSSRTQAAQYYLGSEDELLVPINIWGFVMKPGQYLVPNNTDLISLLSFAGGPNENARLSNIRIIRNDPRMGTKIWKIDVKKYIDTGDRKLIPALRPGDTVIVKGTSFHWIGKFFEFISKISVFAQIYYLISIAENR